MNFHRALTKAAIYIRRLLFQLASPIALAMNPNQGGREVDSDHLIFRIEDKPEKSQMLGFCGQDKIPKKTSNQTAELGSRAVS